MVIDHGRYSHATEWQWTLKFAWLPARMDSDVTVWWREYYHGIRFIFGPAGEDPVILHQYMTAQEFIWYCLTQR
jgi:hypothetical protein